MLFADIAGSTGLYETLGDAAAKQLVTRLQDEIVLTVRQTGGTVQEIVGDEVMVWFHRASEAAKCALSIQSAVAELSTALSVPLSVRIGVHCGQAIVEGERMFGDMINVASRVTSIARGGQIITTKAVVDQLPEGLRCTARQFDVAPIKGKREPMEVFVLPWQDEDEDALTQIASSILKRGSTHTLTLVYSTRRFTLTASSTEFTIGREPSNDLVVDWPAASRHHAIIGFSRDRFVLTDTSTNGTYVTLQNDQVVSLRREGLQLWGAGWIALGSSLEEGPDHGIEFRCG